MFVFISKILSFLTSPIIWIFGLSLWAVFGRKPDIKKRIWIFVGVLYFFSNGFIVSEFARMWEEESTANLEQPYDAIVVLNGFISYDYDHHLEGFHQSTDRFLHGLRLFRQDSGRNLIISGGASSLIYPDMNESIITKEFIGKLGIDNNHIIAEPFSRNTHENALYVKAVLKAKNLQGKRILLVTSAYHMKRARWCFEEVGLAVDTYPVDYRSGPRRFEIDHLLLPQIRALQLWGTFIHEWLGTMVYKMKGYI